MHGTTDINPSEATECLPLLAVLQALWMPWCHQLSFYILPILSCFPDSLYLTPRSVFWHTPPFFKTTTIRKNIRAYMWFQCSQLCLNNNDNAIDSVVLRIHVLVACIGHNYCVIVGWLKCGIPIIRLMCQCDVLEIIPHSFILRISCIRA